MRQNRYLFSLFLMLFLCISVVQAVEEHGICFYPAGTKTHISHMFEWRSADVESGDGIAVLRINKKVHGEFFTDERFRASRKERVVQVLDLKNIGYIIMEWNNGWGNVASLDVRFDGDKKYDSATNIGTVTYGAIRNEPVTCLLSETPEGLEEKTSAYFGSDIKPLCKNPKVIVGAATVLLAVAYLLCS